MTPSELESVDYTNEAVQKKISEDCMMNARVSSADFSICVLLEQAHRVIESLLRKGKNP